MSRGCAQLDKQRHRILGLHGVKPQLRSCTISRAVGSLTTRYVHREAYDPHIDSLTGCDQMNVRTADGRSSHDLILVYLDIRTYRNETRRELSAMGRLPWYAHCTCDLNFHVFI